MADEWNETETLGKSFGREDFQNLNDEKAEGASSSVGGNKDEVKGKGANNSKSGNHKSFNEHKPNTNNRAYRNDAGKSDGSETSREGGKKQYHNKPRNDNMNYRNDTRNTNQHQQNSRNNSRNFEMDGGGSNRNYNNHHSNNNRRRDDPSNSDMDKNYSGGYDRSDDNRRSGRNQYNSNNNKQTDGSGHGNQYGRGGGSNSHQNHNNPSKKNGPKEEYIPPTPTENEDEIFASGITSGVNFIKFDDIPVNVSGEDVPPAIDKFENSGLRDLVLLNVKKSGYVNPTPIQKNAIPIILAGRDIMACAQTGSGKTGAFLLPIISKLLSDEKELSGNKPHVLVVSPTRELGIQIEAECRKFAMHSVLKTLLVYGGTASGYQITKANNGCHLLIATPGRLLDFVSRGLISFEDLRFIVLDEADRMLDMGFLPDIEKIMQHSSMPPPDKRQTLMFSATFPEEIQRLAGKFLNKYLFVAVGIVGGASADVLQNIYEVSKFDKRKKLMEILDNEEPDGIMVFVEQKRSADFLASLLSEKKILTTSMHGDRYQRQREEALTDFKSGRMKLLISTSVGARGLDIKNVRHVINFDLPKSIDEYVHRIGRTGRVGNCGQATSFYDPEDDYPLAADLKKILHQAGQKLPQFLIDAAETTVSRPHGSHSYNNRKGNFGGKDVRKGQQQHQRKSFRGNNENRDQNPTNSGNTMVTDPDEPEENW